MRACRDLAELLATPEGLRAVRLGQLTELLDPGAESRRGAGPPDEGTDEDPRPQEAPRPISIWRPRRVGGSTDGEPGGELAWVRPPVGPLGDHYATTPELHPRRGRLPIRVCWFGESAAAGYLYAPHLTPARLLEDQLRALTGGQARGGPGGPDGDRTYEVLDLARTNETLGSLVETVEEALQLEPDLLVVYTGNNWRLLETPEASPLPPSVRGRQVIASALGVHHSAPAGPAGLARKRLAERAKAALDRLAELAAGAGVPLLLVLPEVNLADWESRQPPVWLPGDGTPRWYRLLAEGLRDLERRNWAGAERAAWAMNALDGSSCPTPFRLLARAWQGAGRLAEARDAALAEVDAVHYPLLAFLDAPRAGSDERTLLVEAARRHGLPRVDLRPVFAEAGGSPLVGRRFFLDYCHLTSEGMAVLGAAVAEQVLRLCPLPDGRAPEPRPWRELLAELPPPEVTPAAEATARLGAALHGAHRLLPLASPDEILEHWAERALDADPGVARAMVDLAAARLALLDGVPAVLTEPYRRLQASPYRMTLQHGLSWGNLDGAVLRAMAAALERAGRPEARDLEELLETPAAAAGGGSRAAGPGLDLVRDERFLAAPLERLLPEVMELRSRPGRATLRALWPVTGFELPTGGTGAVHLELVARLPAIPGVGTPRSGTAVLAAGGRVIGSVALGEGWSRTRFTVPAEALPDGLGRLEIRWPELPPVGSEALEGARRRLELGAEAELHPVFGEVASFLVQR